MKNYPIGVFDSGVGGLTVLEKLIEIMPNEDYIFFADSAHNPYGEKSTQQLIHYCKTISKFLISKGAKAIVIACNTATAACLDTLKQEIDIPVIDVIGPGVDAAIKTTDNKNIALCATSFTVKSNAYENKLREKTNNSEDYSLFQIPNSTLANKIENGWEDTKENSMIIENIVSSIPEKVDTLILGCTHYPHIKNEFGKFFGKSIIDPSAFTAQETKKCLEEKQLLSDKKEKGSVSFYVSGDEEVFVDVAKRLSNIKMDLVNKISF